MNKILALFLILPCAASAATTTKTYKASPNAIVKLSDDEYKKIIAEGNQLEATREVASVDRIDYASAIPDDFKNLTSDFVGGNQWKDGKEVPNSHCDGVVTNTDLASKIDEYEKKYDTLSPAAKITVAQLVALKPFRGIVYRLRPLVESLHTPLAHGIIIAFIRSINAGVNNLFPSDQWKAGFDYLTQPYRDMGDQIKTEQELNQYLADHVSKVLETLYHRVSAVNLNTPVYMDNRLLWSTANFVADQDRFVLFGNTEKLSYLSSVAFAISGLTASLAYNWVNLFEATQSFWTVYGFKTEVISPDSMTAENRVSVIKANTNLFTLLPGGAALTQSAKPWYKIGLSYAKKSYTSIRKAQKAANWNQATAMDPRGFLPFNRIISTAFVNVDEVVNGHGVASSLVNGEVVKVNFDKFFDDPPADFKAFLPTSFDKTKGDDVEVMTGLHYRNYHRGNPIGWNYAAYAKYFPDVKDAQGVRNAARIMTQSWGGTLLGLPVTMMLF